MLRGGAGTAISREGIQCLPQAALGVKPRMRHGHGVHNQPVPPESLDLESESLEIFSIGVKRLAFCRTEVEREWKQKPLRRCGTALERVHELFIQHALVGRVLIDEDKPILVLKADVCPPQLKQRRYGRRRSRDLGRFLRGEFPCCTLEVRERLIEERDISGRLRLQNLRALVGRKICGPETEARSTKT